MKLKIIFLSVIVFLLNLFAQQKENLSYRPTGFLQPVYLINFSDQNKPNNEFKLNRVRLGIKGEISDFIKGEAEIDPTESVELIKDAKIVISVFDDLELTIGRHKIPFSLERLTSIRNLPYIERTKIVKELDQLGYAGRDLGLTAAYKIKLNSFDFKISIGIFNGNQGNPSGDYNNSKTFAERLEISHSKDFSIGINSAQRVDSISAKYFVANGVDVRLKILKDLMFYSEILYGKKKADQTIAGFYSGVEFSLKDFIFGVRFSQYYKDINKSASDIIEGKIDWIPMKKFRLHLDWLGEENKNKFENLLIIGFSYEI